MGRGADGLRPDGMRCVDSSTRPRGPRGAAPAVHERLGFLRGDTRSRGGLVHLVGPVPHETTLGLALSPAARCAKSSANPALDGGPPPRSLTWLVTMPSVVTPFTVRSLFGMGLPPSVVQLTHQRYLPRARGTAEPCSARVPPYGAPYGDTNSCPAAPRGAYPQDPRSARTRNAPCPAVAPDDIPPALAHVPAASAYQPARHPADDAPTLEPASRHTRGRVDALRGRHTATT
eukprot:6614221-Prymnesium_polylepis.2